MKKFTHFCVCVEMCIVCLLGVYVFVFILYCVHVCMCVHAVYVCACVGRMGMCACAYVRLCACVCAWCIECVWMTFFFTERSFCMQPLMISYQRWVHTHIQMHISSHNHTHHTIIHISIYNITHLFSHSNNTH